MSNSYYFSSVEMFIVDIFLFMDLPVYCTRHHAATVDFDVVFWGAMDETSAHSRQTPCCSISNLLSPYIDYHIHSCTKFKGQSEGYVGVEYMGVEYMWVEYMGWCG